MMRLGNSIKARRVELGFASRRGFAKKINISLPTLFRIEHNDSFPRIETFCKIIAGLWDLGLKPEQERELFLSYGGFNKEPKDFKNLFRFLRIQKGFSPKELAKIVERPDSDTIQEIESKGILPSLKAFGNIVSGQWLETEERERLIKSYFKSLYPGESYDSLPRLLKEEQVRRNLNQEETAERSGMSRTGYGNLERGGSLPRSKAIERIALKFNLKEKEVLNLVLKEKKRRQRIRRERK